MGGQDVKWGEVYKKKKGSSQKEGIQAKNQKKKC